MSDVGWSIDQKKLRSLGIERGWNNLNEIALGLGVAPSTLSRVVNHKARPGDKLLASIHYTFGPDAFAEICQSRELAS